MQGLSGARPRPRSSRQAYAEGKRDHVHSLVVWDGLHLSSVIAAFDPALANPAIVAVPTGTDLLFSISRVYGLYTFVIVAGQSVTIATLTQPRTGDLNHDGVINIIDFSILLGLWGPAQADTQADINLDLTVNIVDVSILLSRWTPVG